MLVDSDSSTTRPTVTATPADVIAALQEANRDLEARIHALEARSEQSERISGSAPNEHGRRPGPVAENEESGDRESKRASVLSRRNLLAAAGIGAVASGAGFVLAKPQLAAAASSGSALYTRETFGPGTVVQPALDSDIIWSRTDTASEPVGHTQEILSLVSQNSQTNSYAWPFFIQLVATTATAATQSSSQSCASAVMLYNRSSGSPWAVGYHSEAHHGQEPNGTIHSTGATTIGYNMEMTRVSNSGATIGVEVLNKPTYVDQNGTSHTADVGTAAINIDGLWSYGVRITNPSTPSAAVRMTDAERTALAAQPVATPAAGSVGISVEAPFEIGVDVGPNHLRMQHGQKLILDDEEGVFLTYNRTSKQIEMHKGNVKTAAW